MSASKQPFIVTVDGTSGVGKGTFSKALATHFNLAHLDTGLLYRALAKRMLDENVSLNEPSRYLPLALDIDILSLTPLELKSETIGQMASKIAVVPEIQEILTAMERDFAFHPPFDKKGTILDGRALGSDILPEADVKFFLSASPKVRAERRFKEMKAQGEACSFEEILKAIEDRDKRDAERKHRPLQKAEGAIEIDTTDLNVEEVLARGISCIEKHF